MAMESLSKRNGISMLDCETYESIRYNPFVSRSTPSAKQAIPSLQQRGLT